uniref:Uncharacterized protein n=1 Tax=Magnetococcus massalia (strain MO-1) TaxID=451514 RepID=A0A1S7LEW5_MAGMO|nr:conserved protein of unknown function [Candidatus Magnetococcus massalia]
MNGVASGLGVIPIAQAPTPEQERPDIDEPALSFHIGFRNGRFVGYLRRLETTAPANDYHRFTTSMSGCLNFTYEPEEAQGWCDKHSVAPDDLAKVAWVGQTPEALGIAKRFWILHVDDEGHFEEIGGKPWPGENETEAMAAFALEKLDGTALTPQMDQAEILERYKAMAYQEYLDDLMPGEAALSLEQFSPGLATREADPRGAQ